MSATATMRCCFIVAQITNRCTVQAQAASEAATSLGAAPAATSSALAASASAGGSDDRSEAPSFAAPAAEWHVLHGRRSMAVETAGAKATRTP